MILSVGFQCTVHMRSESSRIICEQYKCRRSYTYLCHVINLSHMACMSRRRINNLGIFKQVVEYRCRNTHALLFRHTVNQLAQLVDSLFCKSGTEQNTYIWCEYKSITYLLIECHSCMSVFFYNIPLINHQNKTFACFMYVSDIFLSCSVTPALASKTSTATSQSSIALIESDYTILLQRFINFAFAAHSRGVYQNKFFPLICHKESTASRVVPISSATRESLISE